MSVEVRIPALGESVSEGTIARWLKQDGDGVTADEPILELETDKATMEIAAPAAGRLEIVEAQGAIVSVGTVVARIAEGAPAAAAAAATTAPARPEAAAPTAREEAQAPARATGAPAAEPTATAPARRAKESLPPPEAEAWSHEEAPLAPAVRRLVEEHGLDPGTIAGTGKGGRLTKEDVLRHLQQRPATATPPPAAPDEAVAGRAPERPATGTPAGEATTPSPRREGTRPAAPRTRSEEQVERVPMTSLRRRIAERLVEAQRSAAILTTFNEVDCGAILALRRRHRERFRAAHGVDLGLVSLFGRASILALRDVPGVNARIDGGDILYHRHVHLGIAVATERGLVVPVIRHADQMTLAELEGAIGTVAERARAARLAPDDLAGGTFSITNGGVFGSLLSTPILNPPQSGILGMHKIQDRPVAVEGQVVIRPMMYVALSYDHRLVDGQQAVTFLVRVKERVEEPERMLLDA